ncbi:type 1 fimbrial protein [Pseudomonas fragi]|uniref:fimbrial protein n=1 Tax=Pseudomonas fragi TaxID=296 RepID=UPI0021BE57C5|nr:fimbrial protein [Pseudomonas fragi]UXL37066.1 type 1 fimbrial protein [Pseudomonas fragi]
MKKSIFALALSAISVASFVQTANASDGQIDFTGSIVSTTCKINAGSGENFTVNLPPVSTASLADVGQHAGTTPFSIKLTGCAVDAGPVQAHFESGASVNPQTGRLIVDTGSDNAENVEIGLVNVENSLPISAGAANGSQNTEIVDIDGSGAATMNFAARYESLGGATAGAANSRVQYTIVYQ